MPGIWKFEDLASQVAQDNRLSLNEGNTPLEEVLIDGNKVFLKRDDLNPTGSQKDRSLAFQLSALYQKGIYRYCISSSGNAAISASAYFAQIKNEDKSLDIFVGENLPDYKRKRLDKWINEQKEITIHVEKDAKKACIKFANENEAYNLRGSVDPLALEGFKTIGYEIQEQLPEVDAIFVPTSSATTLMGIFHSFFQSLYPALHIVQTTKIHAIAKEFDKDFVEEKYSHASAITDIIAYRKKECIAAVRSTNGYGWVISEKELLDAKEAFKNIGMDISYDSSLTYAAYLKAKKNGMHYKCPVLLITGI